MKYVLHAVFLIVFMIIQPTLLEYIEILGIKPNLFLVYIVIISCRCTKWEGAVTGFFFGLLLDLLTGSSLGLNAVLMLILSVAIADFCEKYIRKNTWLTTAVIVLVATLLYEFLYYIIAFMGDLDLLGGIMKVIIPESIYCTAFALPMYYIIPKEKSEQL